MRESHFPLARPKTVVFSRITGQHFPLAPLTLSTWKIQNGGEIMNQKDNSRQPKSNKIGKRVETRIAPVMPTLLTTYDRRFSRAVESHVENDWKDISTWDAPKRSGARGFARPSGISFPWRKIRSGKLNES
jgi:hypothetical protein